MAGTLFEKIWDAHRVAMRPDGRDIVYIDRHVLHELHAPHAFGKLAKANRKVRRPDLTFSAVDHTVATVRGRSHDTTERSKQFIEAMRAGSARNGIRVFDIDTEDHGICHVVAPELGMVLPGATHAVPDSHAGTVGGLGALAFGCGTTELEHILATQTMAMPKPKSMRIRLDGVLAEGVSAKDVALHIIGEIGVAGARGHVVEYCGSAVNHLSIEGRLTLCNLSVEMGARSGLVAPDEKTYEWIAGRRWAPHGAQWDQAMAYWKTMISDTNAVFDSELQLDCRALEPQITWGTDPGQVTAIGNAVPDPATLGAAQRAAAERACAYMDLRPGAALEGLPVQRVFIGSCTNARLSDLQEVAAIVRGRKVAEGVAAMIVPGSQRVKRDAEALGLDRIFEDAGFSWRESGCSMCAAANGDTGFAGERIVSTTNRNFENRQGRGVRTHLASPATAAAAAVTGRITDARKLLRGQA